MSGAPEFLGACPVPKNDVSRILLAHGGGGKRMQELIDTVFRAAFQNQHLESSHDAAVLNGISGSFAFTTDSYVVHPLFFPGGDIGSLSVYGTVNDLAMAGAKPMYLSAGFILEEGFEIEKLKAIVFSMRKAADAAGVYIVTGDTKVVERGKADGVFINTAGVGQATKGLRVHPTEVRAGDEILLSGDLGRHGIAIMASREGLSFKTRIESDLAPLSDLVQALIQGGVRLHCLRDLTRGGLASVLNEIASSASCSIRLDEKAIPVLEAVRGACEILGLDPLYVANEGRFAAFVPAGEGDRALAILRAHPLGRDAQKIGRVEEGDPGAVLLKNVLGTTRILDRLSGEQLPRIC